MIARLAGVAVDARALPWSRDPRELAESARWIAANVAAAFGVRSLPRDLIPIGTHRLGIRAESLAAACAALSLAPMLVDATTLPARWRLALRAVGLPMLDRPASLALAGGASIATYQAMNDEVDCVLSVGPDYRVRVTYDYGRRLLA